MFAVSQPLCDQVHLLAQLLLIVKKLFLLVFCLGGGGKWLASTTNCSSICHRVLLSPPGSGGYKLWQVNLHELLYWREKVTHNQHASHYSELGGKNMTQWAGSHLNVGFTLFCLFFRCPNLLPHSSIASLLCTHTQHTTHTTQHTTHTNKVSELRLLHTPFTTTYHLPRTTGTVSR